MNARHDDRGFTLSELIVAMGLLLVVLTVAFAGFQVAARSARVSDVQSVMAREVAAPLTYLEEIGEQNLIIEAPTGYSVSLLTDRNNDNVKERHMISANLDGTLTDKVWLVNNLGQNVSLQQSFKWSTRNANRASSVPLFHYYTAATATSTPVEITNMAVVPQQARKMIVDVVVAYDGKQVRDMRDIWFRNR